MSAHPSQQHRYTYSEVARLTERSYTTVAHWVSTGKVIGGRGWIPAAEVARLVDLPIEALIEAYPRGRNR